MKLFEISNERLISDSDALNIERRSWYLVRRDGPEAKLEEPSLIHTPLLYSV